ncbi:MAG: hypothetical protein SPJ89_11215 [Treponema sp.]|nr:hypothetical protein [Spirochaetia bacterium]MDD7460308.1 hypothetical protein [Spirochaetales bacterium]MDY5812535.1 hypothetical protein [Treponema sp.]
MKNNLVKSVLLKKGLVKNILLKQVLLKTVLPAMVLLFAVISAVCPVGCKSRIEEINVLEGDFTVPHIENFAVTGGRTLQLDFTKKVSVQNVNTYESESKKDFSSASARYEEDGKRVILELAEKPETGSGYVLESLVVDESGNSLTLSIPFKGYNDNPAKVILSEVRNAYGIATVKDEDGNSVKVHRSEFAELYVLKSGNLCGIEVCSAADGESKKYTMPAIEVKKGDYITVHMRTIAADGADGQGMISETGSNLALSTHEDSCDTARDLWSENTKACFADSDIIYLKNSYNQKIMDALVYARSDLAAWKDGFKDVVKAVEESGVWGQSVSPEDGLCSDYVTSATTRSFSRQNIKQCIKAYENGMPVPGGKEVWLLTADSGRGKNKVAGVTPGYKNSSNAYTPKK